MTATFRLRAASLHQANVDLMVCCWYSNRWMVIGRASRPAVDYSFLAVLSGVFPNCRHPRFRDFDPVVPVDVVRVEADLDRFLDSASVPVWISVNALDVVPTGGFSSFELTAWTQLLCNLYNSASCRKRSLIFQWLCSWAAFLELRLLKLSTVSLDPR